MPKLRYPKEILDILRDQAMAAYPKEACGMLSGLIGPEEATLVGVHAMDNVYDRYREADPDAYPRDARTAYLMDPARQQALVQKLEEGGTPLACIFHSHVEVGSYFSEEDVQAALWDGEPLFPGVEYLVLNARATGVDAARAFRWNGETFDGREVPLDGPADGPRGTRRPGRGRRGGRRGERPRGQGQSDPSETRASGESQGPRGEESEG